MNARTRLSRRALRRVTSPTLVLDREDIDTDRIIPARFLTTTERDGLGVHAFADWRDEPGSPFGDPRVALAEILVAGRNFGCGSSREHAVWGLADMGVRVVVSSEIADIFRANAIQNGLLPVVVPGPILEWMLARPFQPTSVDLERCELALSDGRVIGFDVDPFARRCLFDGVDELDWLLARSADIEHFEEARA